MDTTIAKVQDIRNSSAKFYVVDLHLHSPGSYDWDNTPSPGVERDPDLDKIAAGTTPPGNTIDKYRKLVKQSGRELVAITDHNVSSFGESASTTNTDTGVRFIPGIELTAQFGDTPLIRDNRIHILAIFPEQTSKESIARILPPGTEAEAQRNPREIFEYRSVDELINLIHSENGIAVGLPMQIWKIAPI